MALGLARAGMAGRSARGMGLGSGALLRRAWGPWWLLARVCIQAFFGLRAGAASASCYQLNSICQQRRTLLQCAHGFGSPKAQAQQPLALMVQRLFFCPRAARAAPLYGGPCGDSRKGVPVPELRSSNLARPATLKEGG